MVLCILLLVSTVSVHAFAETNDTDIVILYENDVHCAIDAYSKLAAMKADLMREYDHVGIVSSGDYVQGGSIGSVSKGGYIVELMNKVGYDAVTLGNHEFDYRLPRLMELADMMDTKPVCCNFRKIGESEPVFAPYSMVSYGEVDVAYIGITTPSTLTSSSPQQFLDEQGAHQYTFCADDLYTVVQEAVDQARAEGADYVVALSHIGYYESGTKEDVVDLIENTSGFDVVLDGHSHSVIEKMAVADKSGNSIILSSTGTKFSSIGKLTISSGEIETELISLETYEKTDPEIDSAIAAIYEEYSEFGERKIAFSNVDLITHDAEENRLVRIAETNLGDLCADAFRYVTGADIGYVNGGGIRDDIASGDITYNDMLNVFPFDNLIGVAEVSGQILQDMLEMTMMSWPEEDGSFPHVSGITFSVDTSIPSSVILDGEEMFVGVDGPYRVYNIRVWNAEKECYEPMKPDQTYTLASQTYFLEEYGSGLIMLADAVIVQNDGILDIEVLESYLVDHLNAAVGEEYANVSPNITFTEGKTDLNGEGSARSKNTQIILLFAAVILIIACAVTVAVIKKRRMKAGEKER